MLYSKILQHGHWRPFLGFLAKNTEAFSVTKYKTVEEWYKMAVGKEEESLDVLAKAANVNLIEQFKQYIANFLEQNLGSCGRCNKKFKRSNESYCQLCGLDIDQILGLEEPDFMHAKEFIQQINMKWILGVCKLVEIEYEWKALDQESRFFSQCNETFQEKELAILKEINDLNTNLMESEKNLNYLKQKKNQLVKDIEALLSNINQSDSLYKIYRSGDIGQFIRLESKGGIVRAKSLSEVVKFPVDLIVAFQNEKPDGRLKDSICFTFLPKKHWKSLGDCIWEIDMLHVMLDKISGRFYLNFSNLHQNKSYLKIDHGRLDAISFL